MNLVIKNKDMPTDCRNCFMKHIIRGQKIIDGTIHDEWYGDCNGDFVETIYKYSSGTIVREGKREDCPLSIQNESGMDISEDLNQKGTWEELYIDDGPLFMKHRWVCSECGDWQTYGQTDYCPGCGKPMNKTYEKAKHITQEEWLRRRY